MRGAIESVLAKIRFEFSGSAPQSRRTRVFDVNGRLRCRRNCDDGLEAFAGAAFDLETAAMEFREGLHHGQPQARALGMVGDFAGMLEGLQDAFHARSRHAWAIVADRKPYHAVVGRCRQLDATALLSEGD